MYVMHANDFTIFMDILYYLLYFIYWFPVLFKHEAVCNRETHHLRKELLCYLVLSDNGTPSAFAWWGLSGYWVSTCQHVPRNLWQKRSDWTRHRLRTFCTQTQQGIVCSWYRLIHNCTCSLSLSSPKDKPCCGPGSLTVPVEAIWMVPLLCSSQQP